MMLRWRAVIQVGSIRSESGGNQSRTNEKGQHSCYDAMQAIQATLTRLNDQEEAFPQLEDITALL